MVSLIGFMLILEQPFQAVEAVDFEYWEGAAGCLEQC